MKEDIIRIIMWVILNMYLIIELKHIRENRKKLKKFFNSVNNYLDNIRGGCES